MKPHVRILGIDDSPFSFGTGRALVVGAVVRIPAYIEGVMRTEVEVDGLDSTQRIVDMVSRSRYKDQLKAILIDGIALAGFNIIDIEQLHYELKIPVLTVTRDRPDMRAIRGALRKHFVDWKERYTLVTRLPLKKIETEHKPLWASGLGLEWQEFEEIVSVSTVRGAVPEPLRVAHLVATAMTVGESHGRS